MAQKTKFTHDFISQEGMPVLEAKAREAPGPGCWEGSRDRDEDWTRYDADVDTAAPAATAVSCAIPISLSLAKYMSDEKERYVSQPRGWPATLIPTYSFGNLRTTSFTNDTSTFSCSSCARQVHSQRNARGRIK